MAMVVGPQTRGPPRLLCVLMLVVLAVASFFSVFTQIFSNYHDTRRSSLGEFQRREESLGALSWRSSVSEAESGREQV